MTMEQPVALVNMPFSYSKYPSIQLGTLAALLKRQGIGVRCHYLNVLFAQRIGVPLYEVICEKRALFGEWLFSSLLFRDNPKQADYPNVFKPVFDDLAAQTGHGPGYFQDLHSRVAPQFLTWAMASIDWSRYRIVGFTSTFDQNVASLTLAKLIKDLYPQITIVFGGANFDGEMGLEQLRAFPWIDNVVVGEAEESFRALVRHVLEGRTGPPPRGVAWRQDGQVRFEANPSLFTDFTETGPPDYDDYFDQVRDAGLEAGTLQRILLYEGSRGCWWGEKHHCTFCGLNAQAMTFRAKSPAQVVGELDALASRYDCIRFRFVDNIIDMKYVEGLFGKLAESHVDFDVFIETKSNLGKRQIAALAKGGVKSMQPGIESLSANQLKEMDKGVSPMQNLQCLKWSLYYDVHVSWNILLGFPQETDEDYRTQLALIPAILHLPPPEGIGKLWLERFSPYYKWPEKYGIRITGPGLAYQHVYDPRIVDLNKIAYDFEYEVERWRVDPSLFEELNRSVKTWQQRHAGAERPFLYYAKAPSFVTVYDGRGTAPSATRYNWPEAAIIELCNEQPRSQSQLIEALSESGRQPVGIEVELARLLEKRILYVEKGKYFTLALPMNRNL